MVHIFQFLLEGISVYLSHYMMEDVVIDLLSNMFDRLPVQLLPFCFYARIGVLSLGFYEVKHIFTFKKIFYLLSPKCVVCGSQLDI